MAVSVSGVLLLKGGMR